MKTKNLFLTAAVTAAIAQSISALPLVSVLPGSQVASAVNGGPADADVLLLMGTSGATSASGVGSASGSTASSSWTTWDTGNTAGIRIDSNVHLGNSSSAVENYLDLRFNLTQAAVFSLTGNLAWLPNDFFVEALSQWVGLRDGLPPVSTYVYREGDFLRSNLQKSLTFNYVNESRGTNGDLAPFEAGYGVVAGLDPASYLLPAGDYQLRWNNKLWEGGDKGLGTPGQFPPLAGAEWVLENDPGRLVRIVLHGMQGPVTVKGENYNNVMVPWNGVLNDEEIAAVLTFVRMSWGNNAPPVTTNQVAKVREEVGERSTPWTADELLKITLSGAQ